MFAMNCGNRIRVYRNDAVTSNLLAKLEWIAVPFAVRGGGLHARGQ